jgi:hypothetical protein
MRASEYPTKPFKSLLKREWNCICRQLNEMEVAYDKIDWASIDDVGYTNVLEFLKDEYGLELREDDEHNKKKGDWNREEKEDQLSRLEQAKDREKKLAEEIAVKDFDHQEAERIIEEMANFNKYCENVVWTTIFCLMNKGRFNVINAGAYGVGKSRGTKEIVDSWIKLDTIQQITGHITPAKMFDMFGLGGSIVVDESYTLFTNAQIKHLLRSALYDGNVVWTTKTDERTAFFEGSMIFNTNVLNNRNMNDSALLDRCFINRLDLSNAQIIEKKDSNYRPDRDIWKQIKNRLLVIRNTSLKELDEKYGLTMAECDYVDEFFNSRVRISPSRISMRSFHRVKDIFQRTKWFFGDLSKELLEFAGNLAENYIFIGGKK